MLPVSRFPLEIKLAFFFQGVIGCNEYTELKLNTRNIQHKVT